MARSPNDKGYDVEQSQREKFKQAARDLETNNDPADFDRKVKGMKLQTKKPPKPKAKKG